MLLSPQSVFSRPRVLVVDDHEDSRTVARMVLEHAGYDVTEASTGPEGLRRAIEDQPDVALVDIVLPEFDGLELSRRIRAHQTTSEMRIVAVTALARSNVREASFLAGCDAFLAKPFHIASLRTIVFDQLREARRGVRT
jgi:two-component system, cell cycle response regulator DivK